MMLVTVKPTNLFSRTFKIPPTTGTVLTEHEFHPTAIVVLWNTGTRSVFTSREAFELYCEVIDE